MSYPWIKDSDQYGFLEVTSPNGLCLNNRPVLLNSPSSSLIISNAAITHISDLTLAISSTQNISIAAEDPDGGGGHTVVGGGGGAAPTRDINLNATGNITLNTQLQMPTISGVIFVDPGILSVDFANKSTGYFEVSIGPDINSINDFLFINPRIGGEYNIFLRGEFPFVFSPTTNANYKFNTYTLPCSNNEWIVLKICYTNTTSQYLINATKYY